MADENENIFGSDDDEDEQPLTSRMSLSTTEDAKPSVDEDDTGLFGSDDDDDDEANSEVIGKEKLKSTIREIGKTDVDAYTSWNMKAWYSVIGSKLSINFDERTDLKQIVKNIIEERAVMGETPEKPNKDNSIFGSSDDERYSKTYSCCDFCYSEKIPIQISLCSSHYSETAASRDKTPKGDLEGCDNNRWDDSDDEDEMSKYTTNKVREPQVEVTTAVLDLPEVGRVEDELVELVT